MNALQKLINRCKQDANALHMVDLMNITKQAETELARLQRIEQNEAKLKDLMQEAIDNCETGDCARCRTFAAALEEK